MKRLAAAILALALTWGIATAQDKPATDKPAAPKTVEQTKSAGCGEATGCCGESKSSKSRKASKSQKPVKKPAAETTKPVKAN